MKLNITHIMIILAIISILFVPFLAGKYEIYQLKKATYEPSIQNCMKTKTPNIIYSDMTVEYDKSIRESCENNYKELIKKTQENINNLPLSTKLKLYLNSSKVYWYLWFIPIIFLVIAYILNKKRLKK